MLRNIIWRCNGVRTAASRLTLAKKLSPGISTHKTFVNNYLQQSKWRQPDANGCQKKSIIKNIIFSILFCLGKLFFSVISVFRIKVSARQWGPQILSISVSYRLHCKPKAIHSFNDLAIHFSFFPRICCLCMCVCIIHFQTANSNQFIFCHFYVQFFCGRAILLSLFFAKTSSAWETPR